MKPTKEMTFSEILSLVRTQINDLDVILIEQELLKERLSYEAESDVDAARNKMREYAKIQASRLMLKRAYDLLIFMR